MPGFRYGRALRAFVSLLPYPTCSRRMLTHFPPSCNALPCAALLCAALLAAVLAPPAAAQSQMRQVGSLRVATFNTYLLSNPFRCATKRHLWDAIGLSECLSKGELLGVTLDPEEIDDATDEIADAILSIQRDVDVIVLNEVWDERARRRLVAHLGHGNFVDVAATLRTNLNQAVFRQFNKASRTGWRDTLKRTETSFSDNGVPGAIRQWTMSRRRIR